MLTHKCNQAQCYHITWSKGKTLDFHSKGSEFNPWSHLCADFSAHRLKLLPLTIIKLCKNVV